MTTTIAPHQCRDCEAVITDRKRLCESCRKVIRDRQERVKSVVRAKRRPSRSSRVHLGRRGTEEEHFWIKVEKSETCWVWIGGTAHGYGVFRGHRAHRWAYQHLVGPIPEGLHLDHLCGRTECVNPDHLEPVTAWENNRRWRERRANAA